MARGVDWLPVKVNAHLVQLPSFFLMSGDFNNTYGPWRLKIGSSSAIRASDPWSPEDPHYIGFKATKEFRAKSDWVMTQYHLLDPKYEGRDMFMEGGLMLCVVVRLKNKRDVLFDYIFGSSTADEFDTDGPLSPWLEEQLNSRVSLLSECFNSENQLHGVGLGLQPNTKRPRSMGADGKSQVWRDFTKIYVKDANGNFKLVYAVCHICDKLLKAPSRNGTKTLWRHNETCSCKQVKQQTQ